jgi:hypothetical protein
VSEARLLIEFKGASAGGGFHRAPAIAPGAR